MRVNFSKITYEEVKEIRAQALTNSYSRKSLMERTGHYVKRLPFLCIFLFYAEFIIKKCAPTVFITMYNFIVGNNEWRTSFAKDIRLLAALVLGLSIIAIVLLFAYTVIFSVVNKIFPRKTPISDREHQNKCFWRESEKVENVCCIMNEISKLSQDDIAYSDLILEEDTKKITILLKDSERGFIIKQAYSVSHEDIIRTLKETGVLDFTFLDKEWDVLLKKYQIHVIN